MIVKKFLVVCMSAALTLPALAAQDEYKVKITKEIPYIDVDVLGDVVRVQRIQDLKHKLTNSYVKTSRPCPPFCVQPFTPIKGIKTIGEVELAEFLKNEVNNNKGVIVDARLPKWYNQGTIPGAINIPFPILNPKKSKEYLEQVLPILGVEKKDGKWDFSNAQELVVFDNGPWCQQGTMAMKHLVSIGYPKEKIKYYRGGMQFWQILGLTVLHQKK